jgi:hypothetical protein
MIDWPEIAKYQIVNTPRPSKKTKKVYKKKKISPAHTDIHVEEIYWHLHFSPY